MSDRNGGYTLTGRGTRIVENSAIAWASKARQKMDAANTPEELLAAQRLDEAEYMPKFLESDEDFSAWADECRLRRPRATIEDCRRLGVPVVAYDGRKKETTLNGIPLCRTSDGIVAKDGSDLPTGVICDVDGELLV